MLTPGVIAQLEQWRADAWEELPRDRTWPHVHVRILVLIGLVMGNRKGIPFADEKTPCP